VSPISEEGVDAVMEKVSGGRGEGAASARSPLFLSFRIPIPSHKVVLPQTLFNVSEPPSYEPLESMISTIEQHMKGATS
jgi:hypothetical protein